MFSRISVFLTVAVAVAASARMERHTHVRRGTRSSECNTGTIKCCNNVANATDIAKVLDMLSYSYNPADSVGIDCTPFNIYGVGEATSCQQQPVCCSNNTYNSDMSFNFGCSPIDLN